MRLEEARRITKCSASELGRTGRGNYWNVSAEAASGFVSLFEMNLDEPAPGDVTNEEVRPFVPPPTGDEPPRDEPRPLPGDAGFLDLLDQALEQGHITEPERRERRLLHFTLRRLGAVPA